MIIIIIHNVDIAFFHTKISVFFFIYLKSQYGLHQTSLCQFSCFIEKSLSRLQAKMVENLNELMVYVSSSHERQDN